MLRKYSSLHTFQIPTSPHKPLKSNEQWNILGPNFIHLMFPWVPLAQLSHQSVLCPLSWSIFQREGNMVISYRRLQTWCKRQSASPRQFQKLSVCPNCPNCPKSFPSRHQPIGIIDHGILCIFQKRSKVRTLLVNGRQSPAARHVFGILKIGEYKIQILLLFFYFFKCKNKNRANSIRVGYLFFFFHLKVLFFYL